MIKAPRYDAFVQLVKEMREAQRRYFRERTAENLQASIAIEHRIDEIIKHFDEKQLDLFSS